MTKSKFYFHLLEITLVQILKAHGFDKADNQQVLEIFTDIAIRYMNLLARTIQKYMELRDDYIPNIKDISRTFLELKVISPSKQLDKFDVDSLTNVGIENFENWFNHDMNTRMREISRPNKHFLEERKRAKKKLQNVSSKMDNLTKALDEQSKQAQLQNPTMPYLPPPSVSNGKQTPIPFTGFSGIHPFPQLEPNIESKAELQNEEVVPDIESENDYEIPPGAMDEDWIQYLIRDQINTYTIIDSMKPQSTTTQVSNGNLVDNHIKPSMFKGTVLSEYIPQDLKHLVNIDAANNNDFLIAGPIPEKLLHAFPYYKSDDESDYETGGEDDEESGEDDEESDEGDEDSDEEESDEESGGDNYNDDQGNNNHNVNNNERMDVDHQPNTGLAAYDYYEHHKLYEDEDDQDLDLYGQGDTTSHDLNLFG